MLPLKSLQQGSTLPRQTRLSSWITPHSPGSATLSTLRGVVAAAEAIEAEAVVGVEAAAAAAGHEETCREAAVVMLGQ